MPAVFLLPLQLVHELTKTMNYLVRLQFDALLLPTINFCARMTSSRRIAIVNAKAELARAQHATIVAAEGLLERRLWLGDWLRFVHAEIAAEAALEALFRGFGDFKG